MQNILLLFSQSSNYLWTLIECMYNVYDVENSNMNILYEIRYLLTKYMNPVLQNNCHSFHMCM